MSSSSNHALLLTVFSFASLMLSGVQANTVSLGGIVYDVADWDNPTLGNVDGTLGTSTINFSTSGPINAPTPADYSTGPAFDALTFPGSGTFERLQFQGGANPGTFNTVTFGVPVTSVLFIIGSPNEAGLPQQFGPSQWDFADSLALSVVDEEGLIGFQILAGNILNNGDATGAANHISGVIQVTGSSSFSSLSWENVTEPGLPDQLYITFAASPIPIPAVAFLFPFGLVTGLAWMRRKNS